MSDIVASLSRFCESVPNNVTLIAVSKTKPNEDLQVAYEAGQRDFGENKIQEMTQKWGDLPDDIRWHMIGHTQRNKVKYMAPYVHLVHGVDSPRLLKEINKQAKKNDRVIDCLLQIHIAREQSKFGFDEDELVEFLKSNAFKDLQNVRIKGLMGMATFTDNEDQVREEFKGLKNFYETLKKDIIEPPHEFDTLSMGMTGDYKIAIEEGSNMIRIGSAIFGARD